MLRGLAVSGLAGWQVGIWSTLKVQSKPNRARPPLPAPPASSRPLKLRRNGTAQRDFRAILWRGRARARAAFAKVSSDSSAVSHCWVVPSMANVPPKACRCRAVWLPCLAWLGSSSKIPILRAGSLSSTRDKHRHSTYLLTVASTTAQRSAARDGPPSQVSRGRHLRTLSRVVGHVACPQPRTAQDRKVMTARGSRSW